MLLDEGVRLSQALIIYPKVTDEEFVHRFQGPDRYLRASINVVRGPNAAIGVSYATSRSVAMASLPDCPANLPPCDPYELINTIGAKISIALPQSYSAFLLLALSNGNRRRWLREVAQVHADVGESGPFLAGGLLLGRGPYNAVLEVLADDEEVFGDLVLRTTDFDFVDRVDPHFLTVDSQRGMGDPEREASDALGGTPS